ncbi:hypothetical protein K466DRAFT_386943 [Polyporus arcularius HHB13444]|uniref:Uncharacterized protein n=1 Tax=Polyporus arcularius HHB13444 TaxID=1314778 RepID=A0A5C3PM88_9APHY|nr:hypothetical protein K466DRAFT_386943 [Polyporus arcularius HHB13444]
MRHVPASPVAARSEPSLAVPTRRAPSPPYGLDRRRNMQGPRAFVCRYSGLLKTSLTERSQLRVSLTRLRALKHPASTFLSMSNDECGSVVLSLWTLRRVYISSDPHTGTALLLRSPTCGAYKNSAALQVVAKNPPVLLTCAIPRRRSIELYYANMVYLLLSRV